MSIHATVILDSGCFLPMTEDPTKKSTEIGYFQSSNSVPDIRVRVDGIETNEKDPLNLGKKCRIEVRHVRSNGQPKNDGVKGSPTFHDELLHMKDLYGDHMPVDPAKFDCVIRFESGLFCGALIKPRYFNEHRRQSDGKYKHTEGCGRKRVRKPIAHNVYVHFKINNGESLEVLRNDEVIWSSKGCGAKDLLEIEIIADNTTTDKFYRQVLKGKRDSYWLPNDGDPPPVCPDLPCNP